MNSIRSIIVVVPLFVVTALCERADADNLKLKLSKESGAAAKVVAEPTEPLQNGAPSVLQLDALQTLQITCERVTCNSEVKVFVTAVGVEKKADPATSPAATATQLTVMIPANAEAIRVQVGTEAAVFKTELKKPEEPEPEPEPRQTPRDQPQADPPLPSKLQDLVEIACNAPPDLSDDYDGASNRAWVRVSVTGTPQTAIPRDFDQNDTLTVMIHADPRLLPMLRVKRKSAFAVAGGKILGADVALPAGLDVHGDFGGTTTPECQTREFVVGNFDAGKGEVEISARVGSDTVVLGSFEFAVAPVYSGMFTVGAIWTPLVDPAFSVAERDGQQVIIAGETGSRRMAYVLLYTPFLWDRLERDVRKPSAAWYKHINPTVGFVLDDPLDNVLAGVTADFSGAIAVSTGAFFSHVNVLDGVAVGDPFEGEASALPVTKRWKRDWFFGVTIDVRTATSLVRTVLGTAAGGGS